jgi:hypothetical protein
MAMAKRENYGIDGPHGAMVRSSTTFTPDGKSSIQINSNALK